MYSTGRVEVHDAQDHWRAIMLVCRTVIATAPMCMVIKACCIPTMLAKTMLAIIIPAICRLVMGRPFRAAGPVRLL
ncbi:hypothetical protein [Bradyrhizobium sp. 27S5]|uniref:hypothetical protein n=1 Tax=Bradyrhizobium sp. 27S5 TaxID=3139728 RepID=UPI0030CCCE01